MVTQKINRRNACMLIVDQVSEDHDDDDDDDRMVVTTSFGDVRSFNVAVTHRVLRVCRLFGAPILHPRWSLAPVSPAVS